MKVLVACEESQRVCTSFRELGHEAYSCDILECSGGHPEWHIQGDCLPILNGRCSFITQDGIIHYIQDKWDLIIAHPPCTYFSIAGSCRLFHKVNGISVLNEDRYKKLLESKDFFMRIYDCDCDKICIENPTPMKIANLPPSTQQIQPFFFGDPWRKRTLLWLKGLPCLIPTKIVEPKEGNWVNADADLYKKGLKPKGVFGSRNRSKTFWGIAKAMAEQWGGKKDE